MMARLASALPSCLEVAPYMRTDSLPSVHHAYSLAGFSG